MELTDDAALRAATAGIHRLDVLVHSAGVPRLGRLPDASAADWRDSFEVNVIAVAELTRLLLPALRAARGHVVLINSGSDINAQAGWGPYAASKFALRAYAEVLRAEETGLRVTSVHPARTATDMHRRVLARLAAQAPLLPGADVLALRRTAVRDDERRAPTIVGARRFACSECGGCGI